MILAVAAILLGGELYWLQTARRGAPAKQLPVLAQVPDFSFASETGAPVAREDLRGKIWVADFIFTRCAGPCPVMTSRMRELQAAAGGLSKDDLRLVSVTVDPAYDSPKVLAAYGAKYGANPDRWSFLTGDPAKIETFISKGMLLGLSKDSEGLPLHAQKFVVVDRQGRIRAYHDLDEGDSLAPKILADIDALRHESAAQQPTSRNP